MVSIAIIQNNTAVAHLRENDIQYARLLCIHALQEQRTIVQAQELGFESSSSPSNNGTSTQGRIDQCMSLLDPDEHQEEHYSFLYRTGILIPTTETDPAIITAIILFNTALCHHLLADQDSAHAPNLLLKARQLYELAHRTQDTDTNTMFEFAILNNVAMIYREFGEALAANEVFHNMLSTWMLLLDRQGTSCLRRVSGFLLNLSNTHTFAPAA